MFFIVISNYIVRKKIGHKKTPFLDEKVFNIIISRLNVQLK